jgi:Flp pilus assembly protein TadG
MTERAKVELGQDLVEFALVMLVLVPILLGIFDFGRAFYAYNTIANAAREGARYGSIHPGDTTGVVTAAQQSIVGLEPGCLAVAASFPGSTVRVEVTYNFYAITSFITQFFSGSDHLTLRTVATMYVEGAD